MIEIYIILSLVIGIGIGYFLASQNSSANDEDIDSIKKEMGNTFKALALDVNRSNTEEFFKLANDKFQGLSKESDKNLETKKEINNETIFRIYSMTKPITSVAIMMLYERGLIRLEHELYRYLPEFKNTEVWESGDVNNYKTRPLNNPILISDLLTHTAGFTYDFMLGHPAIGLYKKNGLHNYKDIETQEEMNLDKFCKKLSTLPLLFEPGEKRPCVARL